MYKKEKVYVPKDNILRAEIIRLYHDTPVGGHRGQQKTMELVNQNFWWPRVNKEVKQYVEGCDSCQRNKNCTEQPVGKLMPNLIPKKPQMHISVDFITKLPLAQEYDLILVVVDKLIKMVHLSLLQREHQQKNQLGCLEIICRSCMGYLKVSSQIEDSSLWQD